LNTVQLLCKKTVYLSRGKVRHAGLTSDVINEFIKNTLINKNDETNSIRYGTREVEISKVEFIDKNGCNKNCFKRGERVRIVIWFEAKKSIEKPEFAVGFHTLDGLLLSHATTRDHDVVIEKISGQGKVGYSIESLPLNLGKYWITVSCWDSTGRLAYDHHERMYDFFVEEGPVDNRIRERFGLVYIPSRWDVEN